MAGERISFVGEVQWDFKRSLALLRTNVIPAVHNTELSSLTPQIEIFFHFFFTCNLLIETRGYNEL